MQELDEIKGVDIGETYRNEKQVVSFAHYIAKTEKQKLVDQINESKYISVIYGGFTDTAAIKEEIVYVRTCNKGKLRHLSWRSTTQIELMLIVPMMVGLVEYLGDQLKFLLKFYPCSIHMNFLYDRTRERLPFNRGDRMERFDCIY